MADNVAVAGVGNISTDDVTTLNGATVTAGSAQTQRVKVQYGDDSLARDVSSAFPLPTLARSAPASTGTLSSVAASVTSVTVLAANAARLGAGIYNESTSTLFVGLAASTSMTAYTVAVAASSYYEVPPYTGIITGVWGNAQGSARVTELT